MKYSVLLLILFPIVISANAFAACSTDGYTVVYINGIRTSEVDARKDKNNLENNFIYISGRTDIKFINGYNESHLAGAGDFIESVSQSLGSPVSNYDLNAILIDIYSQVTTRKILLLGHSQGTFYANEIYKYLIENGEQKDAVGEYNVATPAHTVFSGGEYLTSKNDKVINLVRGVTREANQPLPANIDIPLTQREASDQFGGHSFSGVYLANASAKIVSDVDNALKKLSTAETSNVSEDCFISPARNISYYAQKTVFAVADPVATGISATNDAIKITGDKVYTGIASVVQSAAKIAKSIYSNIRSMSNNISGRDLALVSNSLDSSDQQDNSTVSNDENYDNSQVVNISQSASSLKNDLVSEPTVTYEEFSEPISTSTPDNRIIKDENTESRQNNSSTEPLPPDSDSRGPDVGNNISGPSVGGSGPEPNVPIPNNQNIDNAQLSEVIPQSQDSSSTPEILNSTSSSSSSHVLISEVLFDPLGNDEGKEFIELYNPGDSEFDLTSWSLKYKKESATTTVSLASFKSSSHPEDKTLIKAKSFILVGLNNYDSANYNGKEADIIRTATLPNGGVGGLAEKIEIILFDASSSKVNNVSYDKNSILNEGQSFERRSFSANVCVSAQASSTTGEFLGNGCDTNSSDDFEIRIAPAPQNSSSLPEPRSAPAINNFLVSYSFAPHFDFSWDLSADSSGSTSTNKYFIYDMTNPSSTVSVFEATSTNELNYSFADVINEVGRSYDFQLKVQDRDGLSSMATTTVLASSFLDKFYFYSLGATSTNYFFDITTTSSRPFWSATNSGDYGAGWKAIVFYLNKEAPKENELSTDNQMVPSDNSYMRISYEGCAGGSGNSSELILPFNDAACVPGPLSAGAYNFRKLEDLRFAISISNSNSGTPFSSNDYVTLAFYDFGGGGGGSQRLRLAAVDKTKYYFKDEPQNQNVPAIPGNLSTDYDSISGKLSLNWSSSTDADTLDSLINYQINYSTSSLLSDSNWNSVGASLSDSITPVYPNSYKIGVRAFDNFNNTSTPIVADWNFPANFSPSILSQSQNSATQAFSLNKSGQLASIKVFTDSFQTDSNNDLTNICYLDIYEITATSTTILAASDKTHPGDGSSGDYAYRGSGCAGYLTFTYTNGPNLEAGHSYMWKFYFSSSAHGSVKFYGTSTDTAGGLFSDPTFKNAKFIAQSAVDTLFSN